MATIKKYVDGGRVTTTTKTTKKPESTVIKPLAKKDRYSSLGGEIGEPPFGGKKPKPGTKVFNGVTGKYDITRKNGGAVKKAKSGTKMKKAMMGASMSEPMMKSGGKMKKCRYGCN